MPDKPSEETIEGIARAFWRRINMYKNDYDKELPEKLPVEFMASMTTALLLLDAATQPAEEKTWPQEGDEVHFVNDYGIAGYTVLNSDDLEQLSWCKAMDNRGDLYSTEAEALAADELKHSPRMQALYEAIQGVLNKCSEPEEKPCLQKMTNDESIRLAKLIADMPEPPSDRASWLAAVKILVDSMFAPPEKICGFTLDEWKMLDGREVLVQTPSGVRLHLSHVDEEGFHCWPNGQTSKTWSSNVITVDSVEIIEDNRWRPNEGRQMVPDGVRVELRSAGGKDYTEIL